MRRLLPLLFFPLLVAGQDLVLHHGKIVTADPEMTVHAAVAIQGGRIRAVGSSEALMAKAREDGTPMLDLEGRTVLPGLSDNHVHALWAGLSEFREALPPLDSFAAVQSYIREQAKKTPKASGSWFRGRSRRGWPRCRCQRGRCSM
ncbi:MAG: amidohydrolase family protein [Bryobacterales bacterium]